MRLEIVLLFYVCNLAWCSWSSSGYIPPIFMVERGHNQRVEFILALITREDLDDGTPPNDAARDYVHQMSPYAHDDAGHLIARRLGGTGRETYNIIPQNPHINRGIWRSRVEQRVYDEVQRAGEVHFQIFPVYDGPTATRPSNMSFEAWSDRGMILNDTIDNPPPDEDLELFESDPLGNGTRVADSSRSLTKRTPAIDQYNRLNKSDDQLSKYFDKLQRERTVSPVH